MATRTFKATIVSPNRDAYEAAQFEVEDVEGETAFESAFATGTAIRMILEDPNVARIETTSTTGVVTTWEVVE